MLLLRNLTVLRFTASSWSDYQLLVLAHVDLLAVHAMLASLLLLACSTLALLYCACFGLIYPAVHAYGLAMLTGLSYLLA
jgi:hypothetical protein